jgi:hypothetical protein
LALLAAEEALETRFDRKATDEPFEEIAARSVGIPKGAKEGGSRGNAERPTSSA